jgi:hypothetical protein
MYADCRKSPNVRLSSRPLCTQCDIANYNSMFGTVLDIVSDCWTVLDSASDCWTVLDSASDCWTVLDSASDCRTVLDSASECDMDTISNIMNYNLSDVTVTIYGKFQRLLMCST